MNKDFKTKFTWYGLMDWTAVVWAGFISGLVFLIFIEFIVPLFIGGNAWVMMRLLASVAMGSEILAPPATFHGLALIVGLILHFTLSLVFAAVLAVVTHRWGLLTGIILGALFGWALYLINIYGLTIIFPWFNVMKHSVFLVAHVIFGAVAGGVYEWLEKDEPDEMVTLRREGGGLL